MKTQSAFRPWRGPCLLALTLTLAACQRNTQEADWFPLRDGDAVRYAVRYDTDEPRDPESWELRTEGPLPYEDRALMTRYHSAGVRYYFVVDERGVRRVAHRTDLDEEAQREPEALWVLKAPYAVGTEWSTPTVPYLIQRKNEHPRDLKHSHRVVMQWRIEEVDSTVTLADGRALRPCLKVVGQARLNLYTDPVNGFNDVPLISREWYCRGHGLVRLEREERVPQGFLTGGRLVAEWAP